MWKFDLLQVFSVFESWFKTFVDFAVSGLPLSPVATYIAYIESFPYLGYVNWFLPIGTCVKIMGAWLACIGSYYLISTVLRIARLIG